MKTEPIAAKLDREFPAACDICNTPMPRCNRDGTVKTHGQWRICPKCGHNICSPDAHTIRKVRAKRKTEVKRCPTTPARN